MKTTYHKQIGSPSWFDPKMWDGTFTLIWSEHAKKAALNDQLGRIPIFPNAEFQAGDVVEVSYEDNRVAKCVLRVPWSDWLDFVFVLEPPDAQKCCVVRTVWINVANDRHATLDRSKYQRP